MTNSDVNLARQALLEVAEAAEIGEYLQSLPTESGQILQFGCTHAGYVGWHWCCALSGQNVDEIWLEPGETAIVAAPWQPWSERVQPGDLAPGDVIPTAPDDPRLMPGYAALEEEEIAEPLSPAQWSIGMGRARVLSPDGVDEAVYRWREGDNGPRTQTARYAEDHCGTCGWLLTIGGRMGQAFGVCANALSPSDGRIVSMDHGCGAHSETRIEPGVVPVTELVLDEYDYESLDLSQPAVAEAALEDSAPVESAVETDDEQLVEGDVEEVIDAANEDLADAE